ncbi:dolichyl-P-Man:Man(7)GlcNAc(2)-PP-dolichol alpha-1,6-mannosyltransferase [Tyrophagus putrescentiae]|nr:dolichyl-P-Man:Man(7)GlcNAc(2)-PP-dolichol alpha-1,6-mannosyltransferase [Tyrophagus putrescentiae]
MAISPRLCSASAQSGLLFIVSVLYLAFAPYTKVEESFSMQAVHDYLFLSDVRSFPTKLVHFLQSGSSQTNQSSTSLSWDHEFFPGDGILFNIVHNKSNEWGTQPFFWYFYSVLPRMLLFSTMFALMPSFYKNKYAFVGLLFVLIYSILPHKELRFVVYVLPLYLKKATVARSPLSLDTLMVLHLLVNLVLSMFMFYVSANNYPGGESLNAVNEAIRRDLDAAQYSPKDVSVYVSNLAAQSGFTRFLQQDGVYYNKEPQFSVDQFESFSLIYLVLEPQQKHLYLRQCTAVGSGGGRGHTCQLASTAAASKATTAVPTAASSSPSSRFECHWQRNTTAFDRIDLQRRTVNFRTFLLIYRCHKVAANF